MNRTIVVLLLGFLVGTSHCQNIVGTDWMRGLFENINRLNANIQDNVQHLNQRIQDSVRSHLAEVDRLNSDIARTNGNNAHQTVTLNNGGSTILVSGTGGTSRTIFSGNSPNGEPYYRDSEDRVIGDVLYHTERVYNPTNRTMDEYRYTLDLKDPNAKPIPIKSNN